MAALRLLMTNRKYVMAIIKNIKIMLLMIPIFVLIGNANVGRSGESTQITDNDHLKNMEELAYWFIETGIGQYYERKGKEVYERKPGYPAWFKRYPDAVWIYDYVKERGYSHGIPEVEKNRTIARFMTGFDSYRLMNKTECFLRTEHKGEIYEYWVMKDWKTGLQYRQSTFIIAKADALNSNRTIIHTSDQFVEEYEIDKEFSVVFPSDDYKVLYGLQAWDYPENYKNSNLSTFRVYMPEKDIYKTAPWPPKE